MLDIVGTCEQGCLAMGNCEQGCLAMGNCEQGCLAMGIRGHSELLRMLAETTCTELLYMYIPGMLLLAQKETVSTHSQDMVWCWLYMQQLELTDGTSSGATTGMDVAILCEGR